MNTTIPCLKDRRPTLLLVDDEPMNLHVLRNLLQDDYHLLFARDGTKALALAQRHRPDLVLLDVMMPGMSGHEVCKQFKADRATARIPVIFVTALTAAGDEEVGFDLGAVDYITKPVSPSVVKARVRTHLSLVRIDELRESRLQVVQRLGRAAEYRDNETGMHVLRLSHYAHILALAVGFALPYRGRPAGPGTQRALLQRRAAHALVDHPARSHEDRAEHRPARRRVRRHQPPAGLHFAAQPAQQDAPGSPPCLIC